MTEEQMREVDAPHPKTIGELSDYIETLLAQDQDYGTCVYMMSLSAVAAFNYAASRVGATGFQAGCADFDILRRTRHMKGPFMLIDSNKMLYPQYDLRDQLFEAMEDWAQWAGDAARKLLAEDSDHAHPDVVAHWRMLAAKAPEKSA